jgi:hypothetical protein
MTDTVDLYDRFLAYLRAYAVGAAHAQTAVTICAALSLEPNEDSRRQLRACAEQASRCGVLVCSGQRGYFVPATPQEVLASVAPWESQAREMSRRARRQREIAAEHFALRDEPDPEPVRPALFALMEA